MAYTNELVTEVLRLKSQRRGPKEIVKRVMKTGNPFNLTSFTEEDVKAILGAGEAPAPAPTTETPALDKAAEAVTPEAPKKGPKGKGQKLIQKVIKEGLTGGVTPETQKEMTDFVAETPTPPAPEKAPEEVKKPEKAPEPTPAPTVTTIDQATGETVKPEKSTAKSLYRIGGEGQKLHLIAMLTEEQAGIRNKARKDDLKWLPITAADVPPNFGVEDSDGKQLTEASATAEETPARVKVKDKTATTGERVKVKEKAPKVPAAARAEWNGVGMCAFIRYLGATFPRFTESKYAKLVGLAVAEKVGFTPDVTTVKIQVRKGINKGAPIPELKKEHAKEVAAMVAVAEKGLPKEDDAD